VAANVILVIVVLAFAWNLGVHYTGAVMGMPHAARAVSIWPALVLIAVAALLGATFASGGVQETVGLHIIDSNEVSKVDAIAIVAAAGGLTLFYNYAKVPTSTIQILVFCVVGVGLAAGIHIDWATIGELVVVWIIAPIAAVILGYALTRLLDLAIPTEATRVQVREEVLVAAGAGGPSPIAQGASSPARGPWQRWFPNVVAPLAPNTTDTARASARLPIEPTLFLLRWLPALLLAVGIAASFAMGANDVSNATGALIMTDLFSLRVAGLLGGIAIAIGALTWGKRILQTVAFDVVHMDLTMASAAQGVQALVVLIAVTQGYFTSMNQALIGAMAGAGLARGSETVQRRQFVGILRGWAAGPVSGLAIAFILDRVLTLLT
jgi:PiT family inorganic phosphate transporter